MITLFQILDKIVQFSNLWEHKLIQTLKLSIQILATIASPKIANNYSIRVKHRDNIKHKLF